MRLRALRAVTIQLAERAIAITPDASIDLPANDAMKALLQCPDAVRIDESVRVVPGCAVQWMTAHGLHGPARVEAVWTAEGRTWVLAVHDAHPVVIEQAHLTEVNPSYLITSVVGLAVEAFQANETEKFIAIRDFLRSLFDLPKQEDEER